MTCGRKILGWIIAWVFRVLERDKGLSNPLLHFLGVNITDNYEGHTFRGVVAGVEVDEARSLGIFNDFFGPNRDALHKAGFGKKVLELLEHHSVTDGIA